MVAILSAQAKTVSDYLALPEEHPRCELVRGEYYVLPAPHEFHQTAVGKLNITIGIYLEDHPIGTGFVSPFDVFLEEISAVQPDFVYVSHDNDRARIGGGLWGVPDLVVEILSPGNASYDLDVKRALYREHRVREIWIVDTKAKTVRIDRIESEGREYLPEILLGESDVLTTPVLPDYELAVSKLFAVPWTRGQGRERPHA